MYEPLQPSTEFIALEAMVDGIRSRPFTEEELLNLQACAEEMSLGCDVLARLRTVEDDLLHSALTAQVPGASVADLETLRRILRRPLEDVLRQGAFAMASGEGELFCTTMCEHQKTIWHSGLAGSALFTVFEALRDRAGLEFGGEASRRYDRWLEVAARFLVASAEVGKASGRILDAALEAAQEATGSGANLWKKDPSVARRELEALLLCSVRAILPDGDQRFFAGMRSLHANLRGAGLDHDFAEAVGTRLVAASREALGEAGSFELLEHLTSAVDFAVMSADVHDLGSGIVQRSVARLFERHPDRPSTEKEGVEAEQAAHVERCLLGSLPGGRSTFLRELGEVQQTIDRVKPGGDFVADAFDLLLHECEGALGVRSRAMLLPMLERTSHFVAVAADLADRRLEIVSTIADRIVEEFPAAFRENPVDEAVLVRDLQFLIANLATGILPGSDPSVAGGLEAGVEVLTSVNLDGAIVQRAWDALDEALSKKLSPRSAALLAPRWRAVRSALDGRLHLRACEDEVLDAALTRVEQEAPGATSRLEGGSAALRHSLRGGLRAACTAELPASRPRLVREMERLGAVIHAGKFPGRALAAGYGGLVAALDSHAAGSFTSGLQARLERCQSYLELCDGLSSSLDGICDAAASAGLAAAPDVDKRIPSARRLVSDDLRRIVRLCALALVPGGEGRLADGILRYGKRLEGDGFGAAFLRAACRELVAASERSLEARLARSLLPTLAPVEEAVVSMAALSEAGSATIDRWTLELAAAKAGDADAWRVRLHWAMGFVSLHAAVVDVPGGSERFADALRLVSASLDFGTDDSELLWRAFDGLRERLVGPVFAIDGGSARALESARDYSAIGAGLAAHQERIVGDSLDSVSSTRPNLMKSSPHARERIRFDQRALLRASAISMLPGGEGQHRELTARMLVATDRSDFDRELLRHAYRTLREHAVRHLRVGPVEGFGAVLDRTAETVLR